MALESDRVLGPEVTEALANALRPAKLAAAERDRMRARILNRAKARSTPPACRSRYYTRNRNSPR